MAKGECKGHRLGPQFAQCDRNFDYLFESGRLQVVTGRGDSGKTVVARALHPIHGQSAHPAELLLGELHEPKEVGKVHHAGHIGVAKLDPAMTYEGSHGLTSRHCWTTFSVSWAMRSAVNRSRIAAVP